MALQVITMNMSNPPTQDETKIQPLSVETMDGRTITFPKEVVAQFEFFKSLLESKERIRMDWSSLILSELSDAVMLKDEVALMSDRLYPLTDYFGYINLRKALIEDRDRKVTEAIMQFLERPHTYRLLQPLTEGSSRGVWLTKSTVINLLWFSSRTRYEKVKTEPYNMDSITDYIGIWKPAFVGVRMYTLKLTKINLEATHLSIEFDMRWARE